MRTDQILDLTIIAGACLIGVGCGLIYLPLAFIWAGAALVVGAMFTARYMPVKGTEKKSAEATTREA